MLVGTIVTANYFLVMTWFPAVLMMYVKYIKPCFDAIGHKLCCCFYKKDDSKKLQRGMSMKDLMSSVNEETTRVNSVNQEGLARTVTTVRKRKKEEMNLSLSVRMMLNYFDTQYQARVVVVMGTLGLFVFFCLFIPFIQPPDDLPQFLPLDHNVELIRAAEASLTEAASTTSSTASTFQSATTTESLNSGTTTTTQTGEGGGGDGDGAGTDNSDSTTTTATTGTDGATCASQAASGSCVNDIAFPISLIDTSSATGILHAAYPPVLVTINPDDDAPSTNM